MKRFIGIVLLIAGLVGVGASYYIDREVAAGKIKVEDAQSKVDMGRDLFSVTPQTDEIGKGITAPAQEKIDQGRRDIAYYERLSKQLKWGGIISGVIGLLLIVFGGKRKA